MSEDKQAFFIRFKFDGNNPEEFFEEELPSILKQYANLFLLGACVSSVDLTNGKIWLEQLSIESDTELEFVKEDVVNTSKICKNCNYFIKPATEGKPGFCDLNKYSTLSSDTCESWQD